MKTICSSFRVEFSRTKLKRLNIIFLITPCVMRKQWKTICSSFRVEFSRTKLKRLNILFLITPCVMRKQWLFPIGKQKYEIEKQSQNQIHKGSKYFVYLLPDIYFTVSHTK